MKLRPLTVFLLAMMLAVAGLSDFAWAEQSPTEVRQIEEILENMSLEGKIAQMIMPAIRTWDGEKVTALSDYPELTEYYRSRVNTLKQIKA